jgi:DNA polymerase III delta prime subunit
MANENPSTVKEKIENFIWWEKYRPKTMKEIILTPVARIKFDEYLNKKNIPHLFLHGTPGTGKTTSAIALCKDIGLTWIKINASSDATIDTLKNSIVNFARNLSLDGNKKAILLDEVDGVRSTGFFDAMRPVMEDYNGQCTFIFTANKPMKVPEAIQSRLTPIEFRFDSKEDKTNYAIEVLERCFEILKKEKVKYDEAIVKKIIHKLFPDFRSILNALQGNRDFLTDPTLLNRLTGIDASKLFEAMKGNNFAAIRGMMQEDFSILDTIYTQVYDQMKRYIKSESIPVAILTIDDFMRDHFNVVDKEIHCMAFLIALNKAILFKEKPSEEKSSEEGKK